MDGSGAIAFSSFWVNCFVVKSWQGFRTLSPALGWAYWKCSQSLSAVSEPDLCGGVFEFGAFLCMLKLIKNLSNRMFWFFPFIFPLFWLLYALNPRIWWKKRLVWNPFALAFVRNLPCVFLQNCLCSVLSLLCPSETFLGLQVRKLR